MILITGSTGLVGQNLVASLLKQNKKIRVLLRPGSNAICFKDTPIEKVQGNPFNIESLKYAMDGVETIIHCAGVLLGLRYEDYYKGNVLYTQNLLEAVKKYAPGLKKFIHISTQAAAGPNLDENPKDESYIDHPISHYGMSKLESETKVKESGIPYIILRPCSIYGPMDSEFYPLFKMTQRHIQAVVGKGEAKINLLYIDDMIQSIELALNSVKINKTYLVAGDGHFSMLDVLKMVQKTVGKKVMLIKVPIFFAKLIGAFNSFWGRVIGKPFLLNKDKVKEMLQKGWLFKTNLIRQELGFNPVVLPERGFQKTYEWYKKEKWL